MSRCTNSNLTLILYRTHQCGRILSPNLGPSPFPQKMTAPNMTIFTADTILDGKFTFLTNELRHIVAALFLIESNFICLTPQHSHICICKIVQAISRTKKRKKRSSSKSSLSLSLTDVNLVVGFGCFRYLEIFQIFYFSRDVMQNKPCTFSKVTYYTFSYKMQC